MSHTMNLTVAFPGGITVAVGLNIQHFYHLERYSSNVELLRRSYGYKFRAPCSRIICVEMRNKTGRITSESELFML